MGESRWQVHGSTLLTDSAGASGRVHNNTKWLSPPSFFRQSKHASYPQPYHHHTHTHVFLFLISICWHQEITQGNCRDADIQLYQPCDLLFSTPFSSQCLSLLFPCLSLSLSLPLAPSLYTPLLSYFITLTPTPSTLMHMPLDSSPTILCLSFTPSITLLIPVSSPLLLSFYILPPSTYSSIGNLMSCPPTPV